MNLKTKQKLVSLIASGHNTYADIQKSLPNIDDAVMDYITRSPSEEERLLLQIGPRPVSREESYKYLPDDCFTLTDAGQDVLDQLEKESFRDAQAAETMALNKKIFAATLIGVAIAAISVLVALLK